LQAQLKRQGKTMTPEISPPLAHYFKAKNAHDVDGMLAAFSEKAVVKDEGKDLQGLTAIRAWMEKTIKDYNFSADVKSMHHDGGKTIVTAVISGTFPGSPVTLDYAFGIEDGKIISLEIA